MQNYSLTVDKFLDRAAKWSPEREVVWAEQGVVQGRLGYATLRERSNRLSGALASLGLAFGDRVGTLAWNTQHHLENGEPQWPPAAGSEQAITAALCSTRCINKPANDSHQQQICQTAVHKLHIDRIADKAALHHAGRYPFAIDSGPRCSTF